MLLVSLFCGPLDIEILHPREPCEATELRKPYMPSKLLSEASEDVDGRRCGTMFIG